MEPISFTLAVGGLVGIFRASVDCFRFVHLGRQFDNDYHIVCLQLDDAQLRLTRWGALVGLTERGEVKPLEDPAPDGFQEKVQKRLESIQRLFHDAEKLSFKYESGNSESAVVRRGGQQSDTSEKDLSISKRVQTICLRRSRMVKTRTKWALHRREHFNELITKVNKLLDGLFALLPSDNKVLTRLCDREASDLKDDEGLPQLRSVAVTQDMALEAALAKIIKQSAGNITNFNNYDNTKVANMGTNNIGDQTINL